MKSIKVAVQIKRSVAADLRRYARFRGLTPGSIVSAEVAHMLALFHLVDYRLEYVMRRDKAFRKWVGNRGGTTTVLRTGKK